jgi:heme/copper-type cytochrome/quinol oxidase subunit 3
MTELAGHATDYSVVEREPPEVMERNLRIASHLWSSATAFFFAAFLFAYFYLRSLDSSAVWRPKHVDPSATLGTLGMLALLAAAVLLRLGLADYRANRSPAFRVKGALTLVLLAAVVALQIAEWATQSWGPTDGPYASVYLGWTGLLALFVVGLAFWVETTLAISIRYRGAAYGAPAPEGHASGDADRTAPDIENPLSLVRPELEAVSSFASFLAGIGVLTWFILYVI